MSITIKETKCIVDMKIVHTKHFPFGSYTTINIFGILFTKQDRLIPSSINHEKIILDKEVFQFYHIQK